MMWFWSPASCQTTGSKDAAAGDFCDRDASTADLSAEHERAVRDDADQDCGGNGIVVVLTGFDLGFRTARRHTRTLCW
ncbi:MAG: hypothetical protein U0231_14985 [Nitrospiraceae bacterium]